jgi:hypothetical protein
VLRLLYRTQVDVNEVTGEKYPNVRLIDFHHHKCNHFLFVIRRLCMCNDLKDFKVYLIDDCRDLEDQVSRTVARTGEKVTTIASAKRGCASTAQGWISRPVSKPLHKLAG